MDMLQVKPQQKSSPPSNVAFYSNTAVNMGRKVTNEHAKRTNRYIKIIN